MQGIGFDIADVTLGCIFLIEWKGKRSSFWLNGNPSTHVNVIADVNNNGGDDLNANKQHADIGVIANYSGHRDASGHVTDDAIDAAASTSDEINATGDALRNGSAHL